MIAGTWRLPRPKTRQLNHTTTSRIIQEGFTILYFLLVPDESRYMAFTQTEDKTVEPYDHIKDSAFFYDVTEQFKQQMRMDAVSFSKCEVSTISKVSPLLQITHCPYTRDSDKKRICNSYFFTDSYV